MAIKRETVTTFGGTERKRPRNAPALAPNGPKFISDALCHDARSPFEGVIIGHAEVLFSDKGGGAIAQSKGVHVMINLVDFVGYTPPRVSAKTGD